MSASISNKSLMEVFGLQIDVMTQLQLAIGHVSKSVLLQLAGRQDEAWNAIDAALNSQAEILLSMKNLLERLAKEEGTDG